jgi:hypothetical protein
MREHDLEQMDIDELDALEDELRDEIAEADDEQDAVLGHDLRCVLDQVVAQKVVRV